MRGRWLHQGGGTAQPPAARERARAAVRRRDLPPDGAGDLRRVARPVVRTAAARVAGREAAGAPGAGRLPDGLHRRSEGRRGAAGPGDLPAAHRRPGARLRAPRGVVLRRDQLPGAAARRERADRLAARRGAAAGPDRGAGRRPADISHPQGRRGRSRAAARPVRLRPRAAPGRRLPRHAGGGSAARGRRSRRAGTRAPRHPGAGTHARRLRCAHGGRVPVHRRSHLGRRRRLPGHGPQRVLVLLGRAGPLAGKAAGAPLHLGAAGPRPPPPRRVRGGDAREGAPAARKAAGLTLDAGPPWPPGTAFFPPCELRFRCTGCGCRSADRMCTARPLDTGDAGSPDGGDAGTPDGGDGGTPDGGAFYPLRPSPIATENQRAGSRTWQCANYNPALAGYPDRTSYLPGDQVAIRAAFASAATTATWQLWRMGYYGGALGRQIASGGPTAIPAQPPNVVDPLTGVYLVKLSAPEGDTLIPLVVRERTPGAAILYSVSTNTYQAYNTWGGTSLYVNQIGWKPPGSPSAPGHAFAVSFDRPYLNSLGTGEFLAKDRDFVTFAEGQGYDIAYVTDTDLDADPQLLAHRHMLVIQGHSEYWTRPMRTAADAAIAAGTSAAFFAANDAYWQVRFSDPGRRLLLGYKDYCDRDPLRWTDPSRATCLWRDPIVGHPENGMIGEMYGDWIWAAAPLQVNDPSAWIWAGTGATAQTTVAGLYQNESDERFNNGAEPAGVDTVANGFVQSYFGVFDQAETTLYTAPSGAQIFAAGSIGFSRVLAGAGRWHPVVQQLVANLFSRFAGDGTLPAEVKSLNIPSGAPAPSYRAGVRVTTVTRALAQPSAVAVAPDGTVVVADGNRIVRVDQSGKVTVVAGTASADNVDGPAAQARFNSPRGVAVAPSGAIYVSDTNNNRIRVIQNGTVSAVAGGLAGPDAEGFADGQGTAARFAQPMGIALEANGNLLVADSWNMRIREVTPQGAVSTWAGSGSIGVDNGAGAPATLQFPMAIAVTPGGDRKSV